MKDRIAELLQLKGMSIAQFADSIGIQRSTIHHIITGRNKPSLDVIIKIHNTYPDIDLEWLISGKDNSPESHIFVQKDLFSENASHEELTMATDNTQRPDYNTDIPAVGYAGERRTVTGNQDDTPDLGDRTAGKQNDISSRYHISEYPPAVGKVATQVIIVYSDGSSQTFATLKQ